MRLIKQSYEIWDPLTPKDEDKILEAIHKHIEKVARVCYKSEDKITKDSFKGFIDRLIASKHYAMLEHGTVYLTIPIEEWQDLDSYMLGYPSNPYSKVNEECVNWYGWEGNVYITTNYRVLVENNWLSDLKYICLPTDYHYRRATVHCTTSRQITHELVRHRTMSFAMESSRYCNYSKGKFGNELTFVAPNWCDFTETHMYPEDTNLIFRNICTVNDPASIALKEHLEAVEKCYLKLTSEGWTAQQAATILPNATKAEIIITGFIEDWEHLFDLRVKGTTGAPHPQMKELMTPVYNEFKKKYFIV